MALLQNIMRDNNAQPVQSYEFDDFTGNMTRRHLHIETLENYGFDDVEYRLRNTMAPPSVMLAIRYYVDRDQALNAIEDYQDWIGKEIEIIKHSQSLGNFFLEKVTHNEPRAVVNVVGALEPNATVLMVTSWSVRKVPEPPPPTP